ncbi:MAG: hypothetical protein WD646_09045 [Actinomycetota bacterium]
MQNFRFEAPDRRVLRLKGTPDELVDALLTFAAEGVTHVQVYLGHGASENIDAFVPVLERLDSCGLDV